MSVRRATRFAAVAVLTFGGLAIATGAATSAGAATKGRPTPMAYTGGCKQVVHNDLSGITYTAGGKASLQIPQEDVPQGLYFETTVDADAVQWKTTVEAVPMGQVDAMSYRTRKFPVAGGNEAALPAYRVFLTGTEINDSATLIFEPYYQIVGNPPVDTTQTWNVLAGKFWSNKTIGGITAEAGGSYAGNKTWAEIKAANPSAKVIAVAVGQGTYNAKTLTRVNNVIFDSKKSCNEHVWVKGTANPSSGSPSQSASKSASASATSSSGTTTPPPPSQGGSGGSLPVTGVNAGLAAGLAAVVIATGAGLVWMARRRRVRFVSE
jgi:hypothetical protein